MIGKYIHSALRVLRRHHGPSLINAAGLALGLATFLLVGAYVVDEWSYDRFHERVERLYRLNGEYTDEHETSVYARVPPAVVPTLLEAVPDVEAGVRLQRYSAAVRVGDDLRYENDFFFADSSFFRLFTFPLVRGDPSRALAVPDGIVLTESTARRYFGSLDVVGRSLVVADTLRLTVTGVAADIPDRSHLRFTGLISFSTYERSRPEQDFNTLWTWGTFYSFVMLGPGSDPAAAQIRITEAIDSRLGSKQEDGIRFGARLQPLTRIHLHSDVRQEMSPGGSAKYVLVFGLVGLCVLIIAGINFVNLSTAYASIRAREVGVRKATGASQAQLFSQFMVEALVVSVLAFALALVLVALALPVFDRIAGKEFGLGDVFGGPFLVVGLVMALMTGAVSGIYPSIFLSSFRPAAVLKSGRGTGSRGRARHRQVLVVIQFVASVFLIGGTLIASRQVRHLRTQQTGFDREHVVILPFHWDPIVQERYEAVLGRLRSVPSVQEVAASGDVPGRMFTSMSVWGEGMPENSSKGSNALIVDPDFAETYGLEVVAGRDFSVLHPGDWENAFMLNESAARLMGWTSEEAVGKSFYMNGPGSVIGVFRDFHTEGVQAEIEPIAFAMWPSWYGYFSVRLDDGSPDKPLAGLEAAWHEAVPERPFEYFFLDDDFDMQYRAEARFGELFLALAVLAILIACLGLYGLAAFVADRRIREVGIRKVLGAGAPGLAAMLSKDFMVLVGIAFLVAAPAIWVVMNRWLATFASHIDVSIPLVLAAGLLAVVAALVPVCFHTLRAARANPVDCLRYE